VLQISEVSQQIPGGAFGFFHDFCVTDNYYVLLENPLRLDVWKLLSKYTFGKACIAECFAFKSELPMKVGLLALACRRPAALSCGCADWRLSRCLYCICASIVLT
jgi:carotenoid cleavage dioxygenase-like enzyme